MAAFDQSGQKVGVQVNNSLIDGIQNKLNFIDMHGKIEISNRPYGVYMGVKTEEWGAEIERASDGKTLYTTHEDIGVVLDDCIEWIKDGHK